MKKNIKIIVVVVISLVIYGGIFLIYLNTKNNLNTNISVDSENKNSTENEKEKKLIILLNPHTRLKYVNSYFNNIKGDTAYSNLKFSLYENNKFINNYQVMYNDEYKFYDDNNNFYSFNNNIMAFSGDISYKIKQFEQSELNENDNNIINDELLQKNINSQNINKLKYIYNDKIIYIISNALSEENETNAFNLIFTINNENEISYILEDINDGDESLNMCSPSLHGIVDFDEDGNDEYIISCTYYSLIGTCHYIYQNIGNEFKELKSCTLD